MALARLAVVRSGSSPAEVLTFVRSDTLRAPDGYELIAESLLPAGWRMAAEAPVAVPETITPWQLETWLWRTKNIPPSAIDTLVASLPTAERVQAEIDRRRGQSVRRDHPLIDFLGASVGMSSTEIDQAFIEASDLTR